MTPYEVENIAQQKVNSRRNAGKMERLAEGKQGGRSNTRPGAIAAALAMLTVIGWATQSLF